MTNKKELGRFIGLAGGVTVLVGGAFDWDHALGIHLKAYEAPDWMIAAGAAALLILFLLIKKIPIWISLFFAAVILAVGIFDYYSIIIANVDETIKLQVGLGLYLTIAGGLLAGVGPIIHMVKNKQEK